ncbi:MAG TPA: FliM/FliN family flagellar motor switch protein [Burkholderiales bacterium]|nr:FliM/FliN family flagellar motor switch protein [Burkholderiales bacterium]
MELDNKEKENSLLDSKKKNYFEDDFEDDFDIEEDDVDDFEDDNNFDEYEEDDFNLEDKFESENKDEIAENYNTKNDLENELINQSLTSNNNSNDFKDVNNTDNVSVNLDDIALRIACNVGEVNLSISQLQNLTVGSCINLGNLLPTVKLTANGVSFAEGLLVEVDGRIGVKVINIIKTGLM